jgi:hypothetical protein
MEEALGKEVARLHELLNWYEKENVRLKEEAELAKSHVESMQEFNRNEDKRVFQLQKQLQTVQANQKLENRASEGTRKKAAALEIECQLLKEQDKVFREEGAIHRRKVKEYEDTLCDDRAKRLRDMHENELLRKKNAELEARGNIFEGESVKAKRDLLIQLEKLENALAQIDNNVRTIEAQGEEMLTLNREITSLKETIQTMGDSILRLEQVAADRTAERDVYEQECMRLRTELTSLAQTHGERSLAYGGGSRIGSSQSRSRPGTSGGVSSSSLDRVGSARTSSRGGGGLSSFTFEAGGPFVPHTPGGSVSFGGSTFFDESSTISSLPSQSAPMLSPIATRGRPKSQQGAFEPISSPLGSSRKNTPLPPPAIKRNVQLSSLDTSFPQSPRDESPTQTFQIEEVRGEGSITGDGYGGDSNGRNKSNNKRSGGPPSVASKSRTLYVGSGLGFKTTPGLPENHQSAKQVLKKILMDFNSA